MHRYSLLSVAVLVALGNCGDGALEWGSPQHGGVASIERATPKPVRRTRTAMSSYSRIARDRSTSGCSVPIFTGTN